MNTIPQLRLVSRPSFAQRFRWAIAAQSAEELAELEAEDAAQFAKLMADHLASLAAESAGQQQASAMQLELSRHRRTCRYRAAGVCLTDEMRAAIIDGKLRETEAVSTMRAWWRGRRKPWLIVSGPTDSGKSVAAGDLVATHGGVWLSANDLVRASMANFGDLHDRLVRAKSARLLAIEDVGTESDPVRMMTALLEMSCARTSAAEQPVLVTTNLSPRDFALKYAEERLQSKLNALVVWKLVEANDMRPSQPRIIGPTPEKRS